jgi:hypothetical protein
VPTPLASRQSLRGGSAMPRWAGAGLWGIGAWIVSPPWPPK